jgi:hypothetical protein
VIAARTGASSFETHDDAEGPLVQATHQPAQREMVCRRFVVQLLQNI